MKKNVILILFSITNVVLAQGIVINEIMSSNIATVYDEAGDTPDWIELYNTGTVAADLEGYFLSDDSLNVKKWRFGNAVIGPEGYLLVFASDKDTNMAYWHTNFKLSAAGETLILSDSTGAIQDRVEFPAGISDISYGRVDDGSLPWRFQEPSPGSGNTGEEILGFADPVSIGIISILDNVSEGIRYRQEIPVSIVIIHRRISQSVCNQFLPGRNVVAEICLIIKCIQFSSSSTSFIINETTNTDSAGINNFRDIVVSIIEIIGNVPFLVRHFDEISVEILLIQDDIPERVRNGFNSTLRVPCKGNTFSTRVTHSPG